MTRLEILHVWKQFQKLCHSTTQNTFKKYIYNKLWKHHSTPCNVRSVCRNRPSLDNQRAESVLDKCLSKTKNLKFSLTFRPTKSDYVRWTDLTRVHVQRAVPESIYNRYYFIFYERNVRSYLGNATYKTRVSTSFTFRKSTTKVHELFTRETRSLFVYGSDLYVSKYLPVRKMLCKYMCTNYLRTKNFQHQDVGIKSFFF